MLSIAVMIVEFIMVSVAMVYGATGSRVDGVDDTAIEKFLVMHLSEILIAFGATATLLWIPWEYLTKEEEERDRPV